MHNVTSPIPECLNSDVFGVTDDYGQMSPCKKCETDCRKGLHPTQILNTKLIFEKMTPDH